MDLRGRQPVPVRLGRHHSAASQCAQRSSSSSVGGRVPYTLRIWDLWYLIDRPVQEYLANSARIDLHE